MFLVLNVKERYQKNSQAWEQFDIEMRFNINHILRYAYDGRQTWIYLTEHGAYSTFKVSETDKQIDAMVNATNPTAARVLFAKKE